MKRISHLVYLVIVAAIFAGCDSDSTVMYKNITGKAGEMVVVISKDSWNGKPGEVLRETLAQPHAGLPQEEPLFDLINVPHDAFKDIFRSTRNIVQTTISSNVDESGIKFTDDVWAYPQATIQISAKNADEFQKIFRENKDRILSYFVQAEKERITMNYNDTYERAVFNTLNSEFDVTMKVPPGFRIMEKKKGFFCGYSSIRLKSHRELWFIRIRMFPTVLLRLITSCQYATVCLKNTFRAQPTGVTCRQKNASIRLIM